MKRNNSSIRAGRRKGKAKGKSAYMAKVIAGNQMYGPGCCGHKLDTSPAMLAERRKANGVKHASSWVSRYEE